MGDREDVIGIACTLLQRLRDHKDKHREEVRILSEVGLELLRSLGVECSGGSSSQVKDEWLKMVEQVFDACSSPLRVDRELLSLASGGGAAPEDCDLFCGIDSIFKNLYSNAGDPETRFQLMEAYGFLRSIFEYSFLLYMAGIGAGISLCTVEITGKERFLTASRIPFDYGKASMLLSEAVMYAAYKASSEPLLGILGRWSVRRPLSIVNPYYSESIISGPALGGLNPAILNLIVPGNEDPGQIVSVIEKYLREYWEMVVDSSYVHTILGELVTEKHGSSEKVNEEYGGVEDIVDLLKRDVPYMYNSTVYTVSSERLERLLKEGWDKPLRKMLKLLREEDYRIGFNYVQGGFLSLLYMESALYHSYAAKSLVQILPEEYSDILEKSYGKLSGYHGRLVCTNCYLRPYLLWNLSDDPIYVPPLQEVEKKHVLLRVRPHERLCPVHLVIRLAKSKGGSL